MGTWGSCRIISDTTQTIFLYVFCFEIQGKMSFEIWQFKKKVLKITDVNQPPHFTD